jgi:diamine N-acetyltransferase
MIGEKISLRAVEPTDLELLYELENNSEWWHLSNTVAPFSRFVLEQYIMNAQQDIYSSRQLRLMIDAGIGQNLQTVGTIDLYEFDPLNLRAGVGILIKKAWQNKGIASEALSLLIDFGFNTLHLHQLFCGICTDNTASLSLFKKHGFRITGTRENWVRERQKWKDEYFLQLFNHVNLQQHDSTK